MYKQTTHSYKPPISNAKCWLQVPIKEAMSIHEVMVMIEDDHVKFSVLHRFLVAGGPPQF